MLDHLPSTRPPMSLPSVQRIFLLLGFAVLLGSCEEPRRRPAPETTPSIPDAPLVPAPEASAPAPPAPVTPDAPTVAEAEPAPAEPELYVAIEDGRLIVRGALTSRIQQERILETLEQEFPDLVMEKDLKLEYHRFPVGWGNRVAYPFLVQYLKMVDSPKVIYKDGVVTLDGKLKDKRNLIPLTELAIGTFSGDRTRDLVNKLVDRP